MARGVVVNWLSLWVVGNVGLMEDNLLILGHRGGKNIGRGSR